MLASQLKAALAQRQHKGTLRALSLYPASPAPSTSSAATAAQLVDFSSNDYLSLSSSSTVRDNFVRRVTHAVQSGEPMLGSTGSRLLDGNSDAHEQLEHRLASHFRSPSALLFNSGFDANVSLLSCLPQPGDVVLYDTLVHASAHEGMRSSRAQICRSFRHSDPADLEAQLLSLLEPSLDHMPPAKRAAASELAQRLKSGRANVFVIVEGVYSMDGDICPLPELLEILERLVPNEDCRHVIVDEAHSVGVYGDAGEGLCVAMGVEEKIAVRLATFGKAFGSSGAAVLCSPLLRHFLINYARPLVFSTSMSHHTILSVHCSLDALCDAQQPRRKAQLHTNTRRLIGGLSSILHSSSTPAPAWLPAELQAPQLSGLAPSPIVPLLTPYARELAERLRSKGFLVRSICYPTVPRGQERVRICVHAENREEDVDGLVRAVQTWSSEVLQQQQPQLPQKRPANLRKEIDAARL